MENIVMQMEQALLLAVTADNPGAWTALTHVKDELGREAGIQTAKDLYIHDIIGPAVWELYKDKCDCDARLFAEHCTRLYG